MDEKTKESRIKMSQVKFDIIRLMMNKKYDLTQVEWARLLSELTADATNDLIKEEWKK